MTISNATQVEAMAALVAGPVPQPKRQSVDLYCLDLSLCSNLIAPLSAWLSQEEMDRANRRRFERHRQSFILSHGFLRAILAPYLGIGPADIKILVGTHGKPFVDGGPGFSLAHAGTYAVVAIADTEFIGVDVEQDRPELDPVDVAQRFFAEAEWQSLKELPTAEAKARFRRLWTCKEAFVKAIGLGMNYSLDRVVIDDSLNGTARVAKVEAEYGPESAWSLLIRPLTAQCDLAVAVKSPAPLTSQLRTLPRCSRAPGT